VEGSWIFHLLEICQHYFFPNFVPQVTKLFPRPKMTQTFWIFIFDVVVLLPDVLSATTLKTKSFSENQASSFSTLSSLNPFSN